MFLGKKNKDEKKCENCGTNSLNKFKFCPNCGNSFLNMRKEQENFGLIGRSDSFDSEADTQFGLQGFGVTDKLISSIFNSMMKNLDKQFRQIDKNMERTEIKNMPNGIRKKKIVKKEKKVNPSVNQKVNEEQIKKMSSLPREKAKTNVKRLGDKIIYELTTPGVTSTDDVFISKLESGYETKVIGGKKVFVNSLPINLPLLRYTIANNKLFLEFNQE